MVTPVLGCDPADSLRLRKIAPSDLFQTLDRD
jgi:hypothetical protein